MNVISLKKKTDDGLFSEELRASQLCPVIAYDDVTDVYLCDDNTLGFSFLCYGLTGGGPQQLEHLEQLLKQDYPEGSSLQFCLFKSPDIEDVLMDYRLIRRESKSRQFATPITDEVVRNRMNFFRRHTREPIINRLSNGGHIDIGIVTDTKLIISFKMPIASSLKTASGVIRSGKGLVGGVLGAKGAVDGTETLEAGGVTEDDLTRCKVWRESIFSLLTTVPLYPKEVKPAQYIRLMETMLNWSGDASWRKTMTGEWDENRPIHSQIFDGTTDVFRLDDSTLQLGEECYVKVLSAKRFPASVFFGEALSFMGDMKQGTENLRCNYMVVTNICFGNVVNMKNALMRKLQYTTNQAFGPIQKFAPVLVEKKKSLDLLYDDFQNGARPLRISHSVVIFARDEKKANEQATKAISLWGGMRYTLLPDKFITLPWFKNCLPLCTDYGAIEESKRYKTMTSKEAPVCLPVFVESKGTGTPHALTISRNGQIMTFSLHDTTSNKNCVICAESGSGKSFFLNHIIMAYLSEGAQVWAIDAGKSYKKLSEVLGGDFMEFSSDSQICLNPFTNIEKWEDDQDSVVTLVAAMCSEKEALAPFQIAELKRIIDELWQKHGNELNVDIVAEACVNDPDHRVKDLGKQLYAFTSKGSYGRFFNGKNNLNFKNAFTVLELDELQGRTHLRQVVLLQLIYQIQQMVYFGDRNQKKILVVDEAWDLMKEGNVAIFMEHAYRKFRKYGGSAVIATQSLNDLYQNDVGLAIAENSSTKCLLGQKPETIEQVKNDKKLSLEEGLFNLLHTVRTVPGSHSEIFLHSDYCHAVTRLNVDPYETLVYSTAPNDVQDVNDYVSKGMPMEEAIRQVLRDRGQM